MKRDKGLRLQTLVSTMYQTNHSVLKKMNVRTDAIVVNQGHTFSYETFKHRKHDVLFISLPERGVGLSRNTALMRSTADIVVFADEDVTYVDGYEDIITQEFIANPKADIIAFNLPSTNPERPRIAINKAGRVRKYNSLRYGAANLAVRLNSIRMKNVSFSLMFGGGAKYSAGEDSLFIFECLGKGLRMYKTPKQIGVVSQVGSTWFTGHNEKFFRDRGTLFASISPRFAYLLAIQYVIRKYQTFTTDLTFWQITKLLMSGIREVRK